jgi:hypothetical protein
MYVVLLIIWGEFVPDRFNKNLNFLQGRYGHMYTRMGEAEKYGNVDILFIGASHTYRGFDTRIAQEYGYKSFNLGSSLQTPVQTELLLGKYLDKLKPHIIIYEVYPSIFTNDGVESSLDIISNGKIDFNELKMAITVNHIKTYNTLIYAYYRQLFNRDKNFKENIINSGDTYIPGGFVEKQFSHNADSIPVELKKIEWVPEQFQLIAFEKIIDTIRQRGIKLILVQSPVTRPDYAKYPDHDKIDRYFSERAAYYNFNKILHLSDTLDFYDKDHLNQVGVKIFNDSLYIKILKK